MSELTEGWVESTVGGVARVRSDKVEPKEVYPTTPYVSLEHIESGANRITKAGTAGEVRSTKSRFIKGDVLYGRLRPYLNKVAVAAFDGICSTDIIVFARQPGVQSEYLAWFLSRPEVVSHATHRSVGVQLPRVPFEALAELRIPVPPLAEQRRIVTTVETLLARLNAIDGRLRTTLNVLETSRASALAAAYRGLFDCSVSPRRERTTVGDLTVSSFYGPRFAASDYSADGVPTVRTTDIDFAGRIKLNNAPRVRVKPGDERFLLQDGDLVITRTGATIGKCALYRESIGPAVPSAYLIRFRFDLARVIPEYMLLYLQSPVGQSFLGTGQTAVAQPNVNAEAIKAFEFDLPTIEDQRRAVNKATDLLKAIDTVTTRTMASAEVLRNLRQSILAKAFAGELVPTEAESARREGRAYEPASVLLERVRAEAKRSSPRSRRSRR